MTPTVQSAFNFIQQKIEAGFWKPGEIVPATRQLAALIGVSTPTVIKAVAILKKQGIITGFERGPIRVAGPNGGRAPQVSRPVTGWQQKRSEFEQDILSGFYSRNRELPTIKELQNRYRTCFRTMKQVLHSMTLDGVLSLHGKHYELAGSARRTKNERIVLITPPLSHTPDSALNQGQFRVLDLFEHECGHRNLSVELVELDFYDQIEVMRAVDRMVDGAEPVLGYILDVWWLGSEEYRRTCEHVLLRLAALKQPVAVLDENGDFSLPLQLSSNRIIQVFRLEGKRAGSRMARHLLGMGHRSIVYISSLHIFSWSQLRLEGAVEQFTRAGLPEAVTPVVADTLNIYILHILYLAEFDEELLLRILAINRTRHQAQSQYEAFLKFRQSNPTIPLTPEECREIKKNLSGIKRLASEELDADFFNRMVESAIGIAGGKFYSMALEPLFRKALRHSEATAWICANDTMALDALQFLKNQKIEVPHQLSVTGFDNRPVTALASRLTTYDFNPAGFVHTILDFIIRPPRPHAGYRHAPVEIPGIILKRASSAPPQR